MGDIFNSLFIQPVTNGLVFFYRMFSIIGLPGAFGFAIIAITVMIRLLMHPFFKQQMETTHKMRKIKPHIDELNKKHKKDPKTLQQEQMKLYKEHGINPAGGCLFAIIQIPIIWGLYNTLQLFLTNGSSNKVVQEINSRLYIPALQITGIEPSFFVYNLALTPAQGANIYYYAMPFITGILQYYQTKYTMPVMDEPKKSDDKKGEEKTTGEEFQKALNMQMKYIFPVMIGYFSYTLPIGMSLYWNAFSLFGIIQHLLDERKKAKTELATG
jgi:YidC/Oxa1 family membrane protein insertase